MVTEIVAPWGPPVEERPPIPTVAELVKEAKAKRAEKLERRAAKRREEGEGRRARVEGPSLKERHTNVIGGPEVVGGEERVVLEKEMGSR